MLILLDEGPAYAPLELDAAVIPRVGEYVRLDGTTGLVDFVVEGVMHNFHKHARPERDHVATLKVRRLPRQS